MDNSAAIELRDVTKAFDQTAAVRNVSLRIAKGEFFALLGPSGAGKTTIIRLIGGAEVPDAGEILIDGIVVNRLPAYQRNVNTVFQNLLLFPHLTVYDNIAFGLRMKKKAKAEIRQEVLAMVDFMGLSHLNSRKPATLSGGEQQRVAIARALVNRPLVLICDEPLTALDPFLRDQMQQELKRIKKAFGVTLVYITHNHDEALEIADRIAILHRGEIIQVGQPTEIYGAPVNRFVAEFVGRINLFSVQSRQTPNLVLTVDGCVINVTSDNPIGTWGIRPEKLRVSVLNNHERDCPLVNEFKGMIIESSFRGSIVEYRVQLECGKQVAAEVKSSDALFEIGSDVMVSFCAEDLIPLRD